MFIDHSLLGDNCDVQFVVEAIIGPVQWAGNNDVHNNVHNDVCMEYESICFVMRRVVLTLMS
jgi:hypothetical protein